MRHFVFCHCFCSVYRYSWNCLWARLAAEKLMPVFFPPAEVKAFANAKVAAQHKAEIDTSIDAVGAARRLGYASAEDKRQEEAIVQARADLESKVTVAIWRQFEANANRSKLDEAASSKVRDSDAAAAAAYDLAAAAWTCLAAMEEKGENEAFKKIFPAHVKPKMKKAETGTFQYFFKQKMEEETKRRLQREIDIQKEIERRKQQNRPKRQVRSSSPEGLGFLGVLIDFARGIRPKERSDEGSNPGGCSGMDTSVKPW
jgi:hypothetical protein